MSNSPEFTVTDDADSRSSIRERLQQRLQQRSDTSPGKFSSSRSFDDLPAALRGVLPSEYAYIVRSYRELEPSTAAGAPDAAFDATFYVNVSSPEQIEEWRNAFHRKTGTVFRITRADKVKGIKVIYHKDFHCRHADIAAIKYMQKTYATKSGQRRSRNTNCQCLAKIRLEKSRLSLSHPCEVHLLYLHNHPLEVTAAPQTPSATPLLSTPSDTPSSSQHSSPRQDFEIEFAPAVQDTTSLHNFVRIAEVDLLHGDLDYMTRLEHFLQSHQKARQTSLAHAGAFLQQYNWLNPEIDDELLFAENSQYVTNGLVTYQPLDVSSSQDLGSATTSPSIAQLSPDPQHLQLLSQAAVQQHVHHHHQQYPVVDDVASSRKRKHDVIYDAGLSVDCEQPHQLQRQQHQQEQHPEQFLPRKRIMVKTADGQIISLPSAQQQQQQQDFSHSLI